MTQQFKFKNVIDIIDWYFSTVYETTEEEFSNPFHKKIVLRTVKSIHKGLIFNILNNKEVKELD